MTRARRRRAQRGYTLIEVMASLAVLASGLMGIIALQGSTAMANQRAQELTTATNLARRWQERLRRDALHWSAPSQQSSITNIQLTWYLRDLLSQPTTNWVVPVQPSGSPPRQSLQGLTTGATTWRSPRRSSTTAPTSG